MVEDFLDTKIMSTTFIVIPAHNEADTIAQVVRDVRTAFKECRVVVVDDCSTDDTWQRARETGSVVLRHIINRGQGAALRTGTEYALLQGADTIVHFDADGQFLAAEIKEVIAPLETGEADIVFGSRFLAKSSNLPWLKKYIFFPLARRLHIFFGVRLSDPQAGLRAFRAEAFAKIHWRQDRMAHCSEIIFNAFHNKLRIVEVPITVIYREFGQRFSGGLKIVKEMLLGSFTK